MSRFGNFTDFENRRLSDFNEILDNDGVTVDVYRRSSPTTGRIGFDTEVGEELLLARVTAIFRGVNSTRGATDVLSDISKQEYLFETGFTGLLLRDIVVYNEVRYDVTRIDRTEKNKIKVYCELQNQW